MPRWGQLPRWLLMTIAVAFSAAMVTYGCLWMYTAHHRTAPVELGLDTEYSFTTRCSVVRSVYPGSPAEKAGLRPADHIIAVNGQPLVTDEPFTRTWLVSHPGDSVELEVQRPGVKDAFLVHGVFRASHPDEHNEGLASSALRILSYYPIPFFVVGLTVLFLRIEDRNAWLLILLFSAFIAVPDVQNYGLLKSGVPFMMAWRAVFEGMLSAVFYLFFVVFPARSPVDRLLPWLKWLGFALGISFGLSGIRQGGPAPPPFFASVVGKSPVQITMLVYIYGFLALGIVALVSNALAASTPEARRKIRVIAWGTVVGVLPIAAEKAAQDFAQFRPPFWLDTTLALTTFLFPLSFAYAVVKHRVMEIPALLRRSARYVLVQRGYALLLFGGAVAAIVVFTHTIARFFPAATANVGMGISAAFGIALVWASAPLVKRGAEGIDRRFFRSAYDARKILQDLAIKTRTVNNRHELAILLVKHIEEALRPKSLTCYLEDSDGALTAESGDTSVELANLPATLLLLTDLARRGRSWELPPSEPGPNGEPSEFTPLAAECLVPILGRDSRLTGLLVLGQRLSEEPYSGEDRQLLDSVASQAGGALEGIRMAEAMAERLESERRAERDMEIAREVQARLFPQKLPAMKRLEYAGGCIQARQVGGDYYDFLDFGSGRLGIVLADIAGKGISGALLMANLQANLRSQYATALNDLPGLLKSVNRLFCENTNDSSYATLFFANYDDSTRRLTYANCGHNAPLIFRTCGTVDRLESTTTVVGLFEEWECELAETNLNAGDLLVIYTDGITEAPNAAAEEFGEARLRELVLANRNAAPGDLLASIHASVQTFSGETQADDLTLVVARAK
jgi:phosphoserine phosphatase RsbU/P